MKSRSKIKSRKIRSLLVTTAARRSADGGAMVRGQLVVAGVAHRCVLGRSGSGWTKREGDGHTPKGRFPLIEGFFRQEAGPRVHSLLHLWPARRHDGWCDDPRHPAYNRRVRRPFVGGHERLWRDDPLYDVAIVLDYNFTRRIRGRGSAIFFHIWRGPQTPTEGCVAISADDMRRLLPRLAKDVVMVIR